MVKIHLLFIRFFQRIELLKFYIESKSGFSYNLSLGIFFGFLLLFLLLRIISSPQKKQKQLRPVRIFSKICLTISVLQFCYSFFVMSCFGEGWGTLRFLHSQVYTGTRRVVQIIQSLQSEGLEFPEDYVYDGYFSREYLSEILASYSDLDEEETIKLFFTSKDFSPVYYGQAEKFVSDPMKPGKYYWQYHTRDHRYGYTCSPFRIYINVPEGIICVWGVGDNLKYDLTRVKIDKLFKEDKLASVGVQNSLQWTLDTPNNEFPHFLIKRIGFEGKQYWCRFQE